MKSIYISTLFALLLGACGSKTDQQPADEHSEEEGLIELTQAQFEQAGITLGKIEQRQMGVPLRINGMIDVPPQGNISISMAYGGFITQLDMLPGTTVKKGQWLVTIENPDFIQFQQEYLEGLANRLFLKEEFEREEKLYAEKVSSAKTFQLAQSNYLVNEAKVNTMEARLKSIGFNVEDIKKGNIRSSIRLYSPANGAVREVFSNVGSYVQPQDAIMNITDREDLHVELTVYENDIPKVKTGQLIRFRTENSDQWEEAKVFLVGKNVRENRSVTVHGHLKKHGDHLLPGMFVTAELETETVTTWAVSESSLVRFGGKNYVFVSRGSQIENDVEMQLFEMLEVIRGTQSGGFVEIKTADETTQLADLSIATKGALSILAKAKNTDDEGGHGH